MNTNIGLFLRLKMVLPLIVILCNFEKQRMKVSPSTQTIRGHASEPLWERNSRHSVHTSRPFYRTAVLRVLDCPSVRPSARRGLARGRWRPPRTAAGSLKVKRSAVATQTTRGGFSRTVRLRNRWRARLHPRRRRDGRGKVGKGGRQWDKIRLCTHYVMKMKQKGFSNFPPMLGKKYLKNKIY